MHTPDQGRLIGEINKALEKLDRARMDGDNQLFEKIQAVFIEQQNLKHASIRQAYKELVAFGYEKSAHYSNLIMFGGYAAAFAIWQLIKEHLMLKESMILGLLLTSSVFIFAAAEVWGMVARGLLYQRVSRIVISIPEHQITDAYKIAIDDFQTRNARLWWIWFVPSALLGFGAGGYLMWLLSSKLVLGV
jgi:hypothetical protein